MRAFVAVELGDRRSGVGSPRAPEHLTLQFLGEIPENSVERLTGLLGPVGRGFAPFEIVVEGVGAFPSTDRPRVVWVGVRQGREELVRLAGAVRAALAVGVPVDRGAFEPHVTLFRVRSPAERAAAAKLLDGRRPPPPARRERVEEFVLKQSVLGRDGATHRTLARFPLDAPARG